jgi:outer membrane protein assembly factor BamB
VVLGLALVGSCRDRPTEGRVPVRLTIVAEDSAQLAGRTLSFNAIAYDSEGREVAAGPILWSLSDYRRGSISPTGELTAGPAGGDLFVRATLDAPRLADSAAVHVALPGEVKWRHEPPAGRTFDPIGGVALGLDGTVYVLEDISPTTSLSALLALSPGGERRWSTQLSGVRGNYPVVTPQGPILVAGQVIYLVDPAGAVQWQQQTTYPFPDFASGAATDTVFVVAVGFDAQVYGIAPPALLWSAPPESLAGWIVPPTIDAIGRVYIKQSTDTLFMFRLTDGALLRALPDPDTLPDNRVWGVGAVPVADRVYLPTASRLAAFDTAGAMLWLTEIRGRGMSEPAVAPSGDLYLQNTADGLWALRPGGSVRWRYLRAVNRWTWYGGPALARNGIIYAAAQDGFYAVRSDGQLLWSFRADSAGVAQAFVGAPAIAPDGTVYSFTSTHLYAFWAPEPPEPDSPWPMWRHDAQRTGWAR